MINSISPRFLRNVVLAALVLGFSTACSKDEAVDDGPRAGEKPNVLVVMLDDLGYSDIGAYGGEIQTPNMDRLAAGGIRFTGFYNHSRCSPTRAALLTGVYAHRVGLGKNGRDMNRNVATVAETLRENGYQTAMVGKWHLTRAQPLADREEHLKWLSHRAYADKDFGNPETYPVGRGFERHYGPIWGVVNFFDPFSLVDGTEPVREVPDDYYITDALSDKAVEYIEQMSANDEPFFLYLAHTAPHWPIHALPEDIAKYEGVYDDGWHALRDRRYQRLVELGLIDPEVTPLPAHDGSGASTAGDWPSLTDEERSYQSAKMQAHAAMIDRVDQGLGKILDTLEEKGELDNTLVLVLADNGASPEIPGLPGYDRPGHMRDGTAISTGDRDMSVVPGGEDSFTGIGGWWANAANTPWRFWKKQSYDGGVHTPAIAFWPAGIAADAGSLAGGLHHVADIAPTIYELAGVEAPAQLDGESLLPAFSGEDVERGEPLFFEHEGGRAVIDGQWKLVSFAPGFRQKANFRDWALYDLSTDRSETRNLAAQHPQIVERLASSWHAWAADVGVDMRLEPGASVAVVLSSSEIQGAGTSWAKDRLEQALRSGGFVPADGQGGEVDFTITVSVDETGDTGEEGFVLQSDAGAGVLSVQASQAAGAMYGLLEVSELVRRGLSLANIPHRLVQPAVDVRAIKLNLPYMSYRKGESLQLHQDTMKDPAYWRDFLDMMAENRFNTLTLWSLHPFHYFIKPVNFPEASPWTDEEMAEWKALWTDVFRMASERDIDTYLVNWNTFVSPALAAAHGVAEWSVEWKHFGPGTESQLVKDYTKEVVTQTINEYPQLTGLGITLGERMGGQDADARRQWLDETFFAGIEAADRPIKFLYRAPLSANHKSGGSTSIENDRKTRAQIEGLRNVSKPVYVSFKFNWSHGHSTPKLYHVHGGKLSDAYWNPPPVSHRVLWTIRNEDFFVLRWGNPDFIREHIRVNGEHDYVGGYIIGSEAYIPGKDYISKPGPHKTGRWAFDRQWLFYSSWGHLLFNPDTPDLLFETQLTKRFPGVDSRRLMTAWKLASRVPNNFASFYKGTNDPSLYTEGHLSWPENRGLGFITVDRLINRPVLDEDRFVGIRQWVAAGEVTPAGKMSPLDLADLMDGDADEIDGLMQYLDRQPSPPLAAELADIRAWAAYARFFAGQLRGGVSLQRFRAGGDESDREAAVQYLTDAAGYWRELAAQISLFNHETLPFIKNFEISWSALLQDAEADVAVARNAVYEPLAPETEKKTLEGETP